MPTVGANSPPPKGGSGEPLFRHDGAAGRRSPGILKLHPLAVLSRSQLGKTGFAAEPDRLVIFMIAETHIAAGVLAAPSPPPDATGMRGYSWDGSRSVRSHAFDPLGVARACSLLMPGCIAQGCFWSQRRRLSAGGSAVGRSTPCMARR